LLRGPLDQALDDLAERTTDKRLPALLHHVAQIWSDVADIAPNEQGPRVWFTAAPDPDYVAEDAAAKAMFDRQTDAARLGIEAVGAALDRLNLLERKTL
jgi:hypothetical protein